MKVLFKRVNVKVWLVLILIFAAGLRLIAINQSFWLDEATSGLVVRNLSFSQIVSEFSLGDFHPPLYYLVLKVWSSLFGSSEFALRSLSVIFGVVSVYLVYLIGSLFDKRAGLLSSLFLAINGLHIYYSQEARMYSMSVLLVLALVYLFIKLQSSKNNLHWYLFSLALVLNAFTDYLPNLLIIVFWIYAFIVKMDKVWWKRFILAHVPLVLVGTLWSPYLLTQIQNGLSVGESGSLWWGALGTTNIKNVLLIPVKFVFGRISFYNKALYYSLDTFVLFSYLVIFYKGSKKKLLSNSLYKLIYLWLLVPTVLSIIIGFRISVLSYFRLIFVLPAMIIVLAISVNNLSKMWRKIAFSFIVSVSMLSSVYYLVTPRFHRENWRGLVDYVISGAKGMDIGVVFASSGQREGYEYYMGPNVIYDIDSLNTDLPKLIYIRYVWDIFDPEESVKARVEAMGYEKEKIRDFNGIIVWEYENRN